jgi:RNA recognition motif-containing protein
LNVDYNFESPCKIIVNYLPLSVNLKRFEELVSEFGKVIQCKLICSESKIFVSLFYFFFVAGINLGYGFVEYSTPSEAFQAIVNLNGKLYENKKLKVSYTRNISKGTKSANMYINGLNPSINEDYLYELFSPYGRIISCHILCGKCFLILLYGYSCRFKR